MTITRSEVLRRAQTLWPKEGVPYSQNTIHAPSGYRQDCSGFVSMAWGIAPNGPGCWGGFNTVTVLGDGYAKIIDPNDLRPGDAIGMVGPGTAGDNGHIQLFTAWLNSDPDDSHYYCWEQTPSRGWYSRLHDWPDGYRALRFVGITDDAPAAPAPPPPPPPRQVVPFPLPSGHVFGPRADRRNWVHGGFYRWEQGDVARIQRKLQADGKAPSTPGWADGLWDDPTTLPVKNWQNAHGLTTDGLVGPITWKAMFG